jgi:hypothetical protein
MPNKTFKQTYRSGGIGGLVGNLIAMEIVGLVFFLITQASGDPIIAQYALLAFVLASGFWLTVCGIFAIDTAEIAMSSSEKTKPGERSPAVIAFVALASVLVSAGCMIDNPAAYTGTRVTGWIFLGLFCAVVTRVAAETHGKMEEAPKTPWQARFAFAASFLYLPLHFHFGLLWWLVIAVLAVQAVLAVWVLFRWEKSSRVEIPATASPA